MTELQMTALIRACQRSV